MKEANKQLRTIIQTRILAQSLLFNLMIMGIMLTLFYPRYNNKADIIMQNLLYGSIPGLQTAQLVFSNIILGEIESLLLHLFPGGAWYTIIQLLFVLLALTGIGYAILSRTARTMGKVIMVFVLSFLGYEGYVTIGYIKTACLLTASGSILFMYAVRDQEKERHVMVLPIVFFIAGSLYSFKCFCLVFLSSMIMFLIYIIVNKKRCLIRNTIVCIIITLCVTSSFYLIDYLSYNTNKTDYQYTLEYRNDYESLFLKGVNQSYNNYTNVRGADTKKQIFAISQGVFLNGTEEALLAVKDVAKQTRDLSLNTLRDFFRIRIISLFSVDHFYLYFGLLILLAAFVRDRYRFLISTLPYCLLGLFLIHINYYENAGEIYFLIFLTASSHLLLYTKEMHGIEWKSAASFVAVLFIILYSSFSGELFTTINKNEINKMFDEVGTEEYLVDLDSYCKNFSAFNRYPSDLIPSNVYIVNGFYSTMTKYKTRDYIINYNPKTNMIAPNDKHKWIYKPKEYSLDDVPNFGPKRFYTYFFRDRYMMNK